VRFEGEVLHRGFDVRLLLAVHRGERARVVRREAATTEEVVDLRAHDLERRAGSGGVRAERAARLRVGLAGLHPRVEGLALGVETLEQRRVEAVLPRAIREPAEANHELLRDLARVLVLHGVRGDDAVAVPLLLREHRVRCDRVRHGHDLGVRLAEHREDPPR
jgi:hypothetical protein